MKPTVTAVIPTIGRASLSRAVQSVLDQTHPVDEIVVVADTDDSVCLPSDDRITLLRSGVRSGPAWCRQLGIDAATGTVIALLDDDDTWAATKLASQLEAAAAVSALPWLVSSRMLVVGPGARQRTWPRRLIQPGQSVPDYLFRFNDLTFGGAALQTSTLCFPADLARAVRWDAHGDAVHDEASWLMHAQRAFPNLRVLQLPDALSTYNVAEQSLSRDRSDRTDAYIDWGLQYLSTEPPRTIGDYLCTSPVSAAVSASSLAGVRRSLTAALKHGRPGSFALAYAALSAVRIAARRAGPAVHR